MKRLLYAALLLVLPSVFVLAQAAGNLPKVAVLNALIPSNMQSSQAVTAAVTDKVVEQLVASGDFLVLDRANVEAVLKEREFQYSGMVSDAQMTQAGKYLGAEFVVVIRVELIEDTYFVSSRMINVETGIIARQASTQGEGKLSVLLDLATKVGSALARNEIVQHTKIAQAPAEVQRERITQPAPAQRTAPVQKASTVNGTSQQIGVRLYFGAGEGSQDISSVTHSTPFVDMYMIIPMQSVMCLTANISYFDASSTGGISGTSMAMGIGLALPLGIFMPWGSAKLGLSVLDQADYTGWEGNVDLGIDIRLDSFLLGVRYQVQSATYESATYPSIDTTISSTIFMVGFKI